VLAWFRRDLPLVLLCPFWEGADDDDEDVDDVVVTGLSWREFDGGACAMCLGDEGGLSKSAS
jgi:hypothetical protein